MSINPLQAVLDVALLFSRERDLDRLLQIVVAKAVEVAGAERGCIVLGEGPNLTMKAPLGLPLDQGVQVSRTVLREVLEKGGQPRAWGNVLDDEAMNGAASILRDQIRAAMCAPLLCQGKLLGALYVDAQCTHRYDDQDLLVFQALANHAAMAIESTQLQDALTGLYTATVFYRRLGEEVELGRRTGRPVSLVLLDLNGLKQINDQHGHLAGNRALVKLAQIIRAAIREQDVACRYGGDEFGGILPGTSRAAGAVVVRRLEEACAEVSLAEIPDWLGAAIGLATYPDDGQIAEELIALADQRSYARKQALYAARGRG
jgi:diguanylate cyclase (GGDEF)-like protein